MQAVPLAPHRLDGIDGSGVATLMKDTGLISGAFDGLFSWRDELAATAIALQLELQRATARAAAKRSVLDLP